MVHRTNVDVADGGLLVVLVQIAKVGIGQTLKGLDEGGGGFKVGLESDTNACARRKIKIKNISDSENTRNPSKDARASQVKVRSAANALETWRKKCRCELCCSARQLSR